MNTQATLGTQIAAFELRPTPSRLIQRLFQVLPELGVDTRSLLVRGTSGRERLPEFGLPAYSFWEALAECGGPGIGIRLAECVQVAEFGLLGELIANSGTLGEALFHGLRLSRSRPQGVRVSVTADGENTSVAVGVSHPRAVHPEELDFVLAASVIAARRITGNDFAPTELFFTRDQPRDISHHRRVFRAPLRFGAAQAGCTLPTPVLLLPIPNSNGPLRTSLAQKAEARIAAGSADLPERVQSAILAELRGGTASIRRVAARLGTYPHVLTRKLRSVGLSYRELLAKTRLELAEDQLKHAGAHVGRISDALGYSNRSAFNRAFKRATGFSPLAYRDRMRQGPPEEQATDGSEDDA